MGGEKINLKKFFAVFAVLLLFTTPMFVYAVDWGRWINIHFMLLLFTSTLLLDKLQIGEEKLTGFPPISACWIGQTPGVRKAAAMVIFILALSYCVLWSMPHFGPAKVFSLTGNFYAVKHMLTDVLKSLF